MYLVQSEKNDCLAYQNGESTELTLELTNYCAVYLGYGNFLLTFTQAAISRDYSHTKGNFIISTVTGFTVSTIIDNVLQIWKKFVL